MSKEYSDTESYLQSAAEPEAGYGIGKVYSEVYTYINSFAEQHPWKALSEQLQAQVEVFKTATESLAEFDKTLEAFAKAQQSYVRFNPMTATGLGLGIESARRSIKTTTGIRRGKVLRPENFSEVAVRHEDSVGLEHSEHSNAGTPLSSGAETYDIALTSAAITDTVDINRINREFRNNLDKITPQFLVMLKREDFEDGMDNESIRTVRGFLKENEYATYAWLHSIFTHHERDQWIISGLLRIISMTVRREDIDCLMPIVTSALRSGDSFEQEAAVMVIERWRTATCLEKLEDVLERNMFKSGILQDYADGVRLELRQEMQ